MSEKPATSLPPYARLALAVAAVVTAGSLTYAFQSRGTGDTGAAAPRPTPSPSARYNTDGLSDAYDGFVMRPVTLPSRRGTTMTAFRLLGPAGTPHAEFETVHAKPLHLFVIRDDFSHYQHLHPTLSGGVWRTPVTITDGGQYRLYAEFVPKGRTGVPLPDPTVTGLPFAIYGPTTPDPVPAPVPAQTSGTLTVTRADGVANLIVGQQRALQFKITENGQPARLEKYLDADAHLAVFEVRTGRLQHMHPLPANANGAPPADGVVSFHPQFAERGDQRLYLQFQVAGKVHQVAFTLMVT
ncbi:hypothetical protein GCM10010124_08890 [Pilimelia terevasa]|uniref:Secreted protein n=1 Tax=Pilimelia terevasa TaxID=53372 RepID=A0A8J3BLV9_9ACTN|nr:hypothetical protein [Pilimelia terevasa]GGK18511.1 hypothetical protein GCM10010124_08890 [Pilimelia terevasa]